MRALLSLIILFLCSCTINIVDRRLTREDVNAALAKIAARFDADEKALIEVIKRVPFEKKKK